MRLSGKSGRECRAVPSGGRRDSNAGLRSAGRGTIRKLVQDPYCLSYVFADLPDDGSNVAITCPVSGHTFYASVMERL